MRIVNEYQCLPPVQDIAVQQVITHPDYDFSRANDIALIRLADESDFSKHAVRPICLPLSPELMSLSLKYYIVSGWGTTEDQRRSDKLLKARVPSLELEKCQNLFRSFQLGSGQICVGGDNRVDSCQGDSGENYLTF